MRPDASRAVSLPTCLPDFVHVNRFWDKHSRMPMAKILPGEYYVTTQNEVIGTVLGSCISACIRDIVYGIGGMNHFMLPHDASSSGSTGSASNAARYGSFAMEHLINDILKQGGKRKNLEVKLFGGANVMGGTVSNSIGYQNSNFVRQYLRTEGMDIAAEDLNGVHPRKVIYYPKTGRVRVKHLEQLHNNTILEREQNYKQSIDKADVGGDVELF